VTVAGASVTLKAANIYTGTTTVNGTLKVGQSDAIPSTSPVIVAGGIRFSQAAQLGYLGFGDAYRMTGEGSIVYLITDWMAVAYEYRQKKNPYQTLGSLVGREEAWQAVDLAFIVTDRLTFAVGWLCAGNVANGRVDNGWGFQLKYEF